MSAIEAFETSALFETIHTGKIYPIRTLFIVIAASLSPCLFLIFCSIHLETRYPLCNDHLFKRPTPYLVNTFPN